MWRSRDNYDILTLPLDYNRKFTDLNRQEIKTYFEWFLNIKKERLYKLCQFLFVDNENCLCEKNLSTL